MFAMCQSGQFSWFIETHAACVNPHFLWDRCESYISYETCFSMGVTHVSISASLSTLGVVMCEEILHIRFLVVKFMIFFGNV